MKIELKDIIKLIDCDEDKSYQRINIISNENGLIFTGTKEMITQINIDSYIIKNMYADEDGDINIIVYEENQIKNDIKDGERKKVQCAKYPSEKCIYCENKTFKKCSLCKHNLYLNLRVSRLAQDYFEKSE